MSTHQSRSDRLVGAAAKIRGAHGKLDVAAEIRRRFLAGWAAGGVNAPVAVAAARSAGQAAAVPHMGAHALVKAIVRVGALKTLPQWTKGSDRGSWTARPTDAHSAIGAELDRPR